MSKNSMYNDLVKCNIFNVTDIENTKVYEDDTVINSEYANDTKKYKVETDGMNNEEVIIALLAKQTLYMKMIKNVVVATFVLAVLGVIAIFT